MKKAYNRVIITVIIAMLLIPLQAFAAKTNYLFDNQMSITDSTGNGTGDATEYTVTVSGSILSEKTNTITIFNEGETEAVIGFGYSVSGQSAFTIAGASVSENGDYSIVVASRSELVITLKAAARKKATLTLANITYSPVVSSSEIKFEFDNTLGTVAVGGQDVTSGSSVTVEEAGAEVVATPVSGANFVAWVDENNKIISKESAYIQLSVGNCTVRALFTRNTPYFMVNNSYVLSDLNQAVSKGSNIVLVCNGVLPAGDYTIPAGVTLLIPFDDGNTLYTTVPGSDNQKYEEPKVYRTLTMASGANITVNGAISVSAKQSCSQGSNGSPIGTYGLVTMEDGSSITVNSGGNLYVWGYITGAGEITAKQGAMVYEDFQVRDWRGGNATTDMLNNEQRVFPMSQYYVQNIEVPLTLEAGAVENGYMSVYVTLVGIQGSTVPFIGRDGMFRIQSGSITKDYDEETDRLVISVDGDMDMQSLSISMKLSLIGTQTVNSANYTLPINGNITLHINSGSGVVISQEMALLPGGVINIYKGAECTFDSGAKVFIYDKDEWGNYCSHQNKVIMPVIFAPGRMYTRSEADLTDAKVYVEGTIDADNGFAYTTQSGADVCATEGGLVRLQTDTETTVTYQATYNSDKSTTYNEIQVTTAKLKNADGTYIDPEVLGECCSEYVYSDGKWIPQTFNHTGVVTVSGVEPTCTEEGKSDSSYCSACNMVIKEQETVSALGHAYGQFIPDGKVNHKKVCANDSSHIIMEEHTFVDLNCSACGCEKIVTDTDYTISGENIVINTSLVVDVPSDTKIIIATYDFFGRLLEVTYSTAGSIKEETLSAQDVKMIKVFAWDGFSLINPVSVAEEIQL